MAASIPIPAVTGLPPPGRPKPVFKYPRDVVGAVIARRRAGIANSMLKYPLPGSSQDSAIVLGDDPSSSESSSEEETAASAAKTSSFGVERSRQPILAVDHAGAPQQTNTQPNSASPRSSEPRSNGEEIPNTTPDGSKDAPSSGPPSVTDGSADSTAQNEVLASSQPVAESAPAGIDQGEQSTKEAPPSNKPFHEAPAIGGRGRLHAKFTSPAPSNTQGPPPQRTQLPEKYVRFSEGSNGQAASNSQVPTSLVQALGSQGEFCTAGKEMESRGMASDDGQEETDKPQTEVIKGPHRPALLLKGNRPAPRRARFSGPPEEFDSQTTSDSDSDPPTPVKRRRVALAGVPYEHRTWESEIVAERRTRQPPAKQTANEPGARSLGLDMASLPTKRRTGKGARGSGHRSQRRSRIPKGEYEVERVVEQRGQRYFIKWKGYSASENTWEPLENLTNCRLLLGVFRRRQRMIARRRVHPQSGKDWA